MPATTDSHHHGLRPEDTAEAKLRLRVSNPILPTLVLPRVRDELDFDVHRKLVHNVSNGDIKLVLRIRDIRFPRLSSGYARRWGLVLCGE